MRNLGRNQVCRFAANETTSVLVETTTTIPMLAMLTYGSVTLGFLMNDYVTLDLLKLRANLRESPPPS